MTSPDIEKCGHSWYLDNRRLSNEEVEQINPTYGSPEKYRDAVRETSQLLLDLEEAPLSPAPERDTVRGRGAVRSSVETDPRNFKPLRPGSLQDRPFVTLLGQGYVDYSGVVVKNPRTVADITATKALAK